MPMEGGVPYPNGMFSRRHKTAEAHQAAKAQRQADELAYIADIRQRNEDAAKRTPQEQVKRLDALLGKGQGAKRERARLASKIALEKAGRKAKS